MNSTILAVPRPIGSYLSAEAPGSWIGPYHLLEVIGEGGCGTVYAAEQREPVRRTVALKVIKLGMDTRAVVRRFELERQALAMMDHPGIARVFDAGSTEVGRPYFVMEFVRGTRITDYCDRNQLTTQERLDLFIKVCQAIQHAHQKGAIHRDIKPSNILVTVMDGEPVPKVIDFGIAKATGDRLTGATTLTQLQQFLGTPAYMSPEQAEMKHPDVDTRSDIYSLGVLLYELLTGRPPFDPEALLQDGLEAICRTIREVEPPRPSTRLSTLRGDVLAATAKQHKTEAARLLSRVRGDLDWIVMKCLEKDRNRRYDTAIGLANDLRRHLDNEPVAARPASLSDRLRKLLRRHRIAFTVAAALFLALLTGLGAFSRLYIHEKRLNTATGFLVGMLNSLDPGMAQGDTAAMLQKVLDDTAGRVAKDLRNDPEMQADLRDTIGHVYFVLGQYEKAEATQRAAIAARLAAAGRESLPLATELGLLATTLASQNRMTEAEAMHRQALELRRKLIGSESPEVAESLNDLSMVLFDEGLLDEAEQLQGQALGLSRKLRGEESPQVASSLNNMAAILVGRHKYAEAEKLQRQELALSTRLLGTNDPSLAISLNNLALLLSDQGKLPEAESEARKALELRQRVLPKDHPDLAQSMDALGRVLSDEKKFTNAQPFLQEALALRRSVLGTNSLDVALSLEHLAEVYEQELRLAETEDLLMQSLAIREKAAPDAVWNFSVRSRLGGILARQKKFAEAESLLLSGYEGIKQRDHQAPGGDKPGLRPPLERLVKFYQDTGNPDAAATWQHRLDELKTADKATPTGQAPAERK